MNVYDQTAGTGDDRASQLLRAAERARRGGQTRRALALLVAARGAAGDNAPLRARAELLRGLLLLGDGPVADAHQILLLAAESSGAHDVEGAEQALAAAAEAAWAAGDLTAYLQSLERPAGRPADGTPPSGRTESAGTVAAPWGAFRAGMRHAVLVDFARAAQEMEPLLAAAARTQRPDALLYAGRAALVLGDITVARRLLGRALAAAGAEGVSDLTARILEFLAYAELRAGLHHQARAHAEEGLRAARRLGQRNFGAQHHALLALVFSLVDADGAAEHHGEAALAVARPHGLLQVSTMAEWARARSDLGHGRAEQAAVRLGPLLRPGPRRGHFGLWMLAVPCLVEATVLAGLDEGVTDMVDLYAGWAALGADAQATAQLTRLRALTARDEDCEALYQQALTEHEAAGESQFEHARTLLAYGMWLRRRRRPLEARLQLRSALVGFERCGALLWEKRTRSELRAAGDSAANDDVRALGRLTAQQQRVAGLVSSGATNREVATRLSLSPRTVDHHLRNIFSQLGVRSRVELALLMNGGQTERSGGSGGGKA
ncbi:LuxR C-terminal-related transcriptional regulator [Streptomyces caelestis]|uniref:helix-turn-helix transcriptional regulator n=1 Tax=Streptomyces TaxID=1883 RepID=UPI00068D9DD4|nr:MULTISPECIES: LuxR family transcriptional regulator [Streptomyces]